MWDRWSGLIYIGSLDVDDDGRSLGGHVHLEVLHVHCNIHGGIKFHGYAMFCTYISECVFPCVYACIN